MIEEIQIILLETEVNVIYKFLFLSYQLTLTHFWLMFLFYTL